MNIREIQTVKIGAVRYNVQHTEIEQSRKPEDADMVSIGNIQYSEGLIQVSNKIPEHVAVVTIVHECVHGLLRHSGSFCLSEDDVDGLANTLVLFIQENPQLIQAIQAGKQ